MEDHPGQKRFVESKHKRKIIRAGRRWGKTISAVELAVLAFVDGKSVDYGAPVIDQVQTFWHEAVIALADPIEDGIFRKLESEKKIFKPGSLPEQYIQCHTVFNPDVMRGGSTDLLILDEFQLMSEEVWERVCPPRLADRDGDAVFIYTPPSMRMRAKTQARDPLYCAKMFKRYQNDPRWLCMTATSYDNPNISEAGLASVTVDLTDLGKRQEIMAEDIDEVPGALWKPSMIEETRVREAPALLRIVVGVDPTGSSTNECGIVAAGMGADGHGYVIEDASLLAPTPKQWAAAVTWLYYDKKADRILGEENYGGQMVETTITMHDANLSYANVRATRGKLVRAEPICALYEKGAIHHVGNFPQLEEEMCSYVPGNRSPNRMDALVWCLTELFPEAVRLTLVESRLDEMKRIETKIAVAKSTMMKPALPENADHCPRCDSPLIVKRGPLKHCNSCGEEWGAVMVKAEGGRRGL